MRLRRHGLAVVADVAHVRHHVGPVPAVVQGLPFALADELPHVRGLPAHEGRPERRLVGPLAFLVAVRAPLAVDLGHGHVLADQARDHAGPAPVRVHVVDVLGHDRVVPVRRGQAVVVLPPLAVLVIPARVLVLEPLEVLVRHGVDPPVVGEPAGGEELGDLVHVALVPDLVPRFLDEVVRNDQAVLLQRHEVAAVVVVVDPPAPHLGVGLAVLAPVLGAVLDERADGGVHHAMVVPPRVAQVALEQLVVALVGQRHQQRGVAVGDVPGLVRLHRVEHGGQQVVAVRRGLGRHGHEQRVREGRLGHDGQVDRRGGDGVTGDEALGELPADGPAVVVLEVPEAVVEAGRVDVVVHVQALQVLLDRRVTYLVDHLDRLAVVQLGVGDRAEQQRHGARRRYFRQRDDGQEQLLPFQPPLLHLAEHIAADGAVLRAVHAVVLLFLHREVGPEDLLQRVLLLRLAERVVRPVLRHRLVVLRLPGQFLDLLVSLGHTLATHRHPFLGGFRGRGARCGPEGLQPTAPKVLVCCITSRKPRSWALNMRHLEGGADLGEALIPLVNFDPVSFRGRLDAERPQQVSRWFAGIARLAEDRMQSLVRQMVENEVDDAPGIEGLRVVRMGRLTVGVHAPTQRRLVRGGSLNLRQCHGTWGLLCNGRVNPGPVGQALSRV